MATFLLDLDGVMANSTKQMIAKVQKELGINFKQRDWIEYGSLEAKIMQETGWDIDTVRSFITGSDIIDEAPMIPHAANYLRKCTMLGHRFVVATGRSDKQTNSTVYWIKTRFPTIKNHDIYLRPKGLSSAEIKRKIAIKYQVAAILDDDPSIVTEHANTPDFAAVLVGLMDHSWNQGYQYQVSQYRKRFGNWKTGDHGWAGFYNWVKETYHS